LETAGQKLVLGPETGTNTREGIFSEMTTGGSIAPYDKRKQETLR